MIAIDTNVLVRFLVEDDIDQSKRATAVIQKVIDDDDSILICDVVIVETAWVLSRSYQFSREEIGTTIQKLLAARNIVFTSFERVANALRSYKKGKADFSDYVIREQARESECDKTATFDRTLLKEPGFFEP